MSHDTHRKYFTINSKITFCTYIQIYVLTTIMNDGTVFDQSEIHRWSRLTDGHVNVAMVRSTGGCTLKRATENPSSVLLFNHTHGPRRRTEVGRIANRCPARRTDILTLVDAFAFQSGVVVVFDGLAFRGEVINDLYRHSRVVLLDVLVAVSTQRCAVFTVPTLVGFETLKTRCSHSSSS